MTCIARMPTIRRAPHGKPWVRAQGSQILNSSPGSLNEEEHQQDDAVIGQAFRWSLIVLLLAVVAGLLIWRLSWEPESEQSTIDKDTSRIESLTVDVETMPEFNFTDIATSAGVDFVHQNGAVGEKLLPETMGGGVAFLDYNSDGRPDLFLVNGKNWNASESDSNQETVGSRLYRNLGDGRFQDATAEAGLEFESYGMGCAVGDYDNDGDPDLFVSAVGKNMLFRNDGGRFVDVTESAGVAGDVDAWSTSCGFFDYDNDGDLDLLVCNYVRWSKEIDFALNYTLNGRDRAYGPPTGYEGCFPYLYRNDDGVFQEVAEEAGLFVKNPDTDTPVAKSLALIFLDGDQDGWTDVLIANDTVQNQMFRNQRDGTFEELGALSGIGFDRNGQATGAMGTDIGFPFGEPRMAIGIGNFANEMTSLYVSQDNLMTFVDQSLVEGVGAPSRACLTFGVLFLDIDSDGREDFLQANGHLEAEINEIQPSQSYAQPPQLFWNQGPNAERCFAAVPETNLADFGKPLVGRGAAYADWDGDGDLDLAFTQIGRPPALLRNDTPTNHHWIKLRLVGTVSNRDAVGSQVTCYAGDQVHHRFVSRTRSYLSQVELPLTIGLGQANQVDRLIIRWPNGLETELENLASGALHEIIESE